MDEDFDILESTVGFLNALNRSIVRRRVLKSAIVKKIIIQNSKKRRRLGRLKTSSSCWGQMLCHADQLEDSQSRTAALFRRRFRVPYPIFKVILEMVRSHPDFVEHDNRADALGILAVPLNLKVLGALRILARSSTFDEVNELTNMGEETMRAFFHKFVGIFSSEEVYSQFVYPPRTKKTLKIVEREYRKRGLPGCVGSVDCVHVAWDVCPVRLWHMHNGKEGYRSVAFEVVVDHNRRIQSTTVPFAGAWNDKTIVRFDGYVSKLRRGELFHDIDPGQEWKYYAKERLPDGSEVLLLRSEKGYYLICDGGYHKWRVLQCPNKVTANATVMKWSKVVESMRKDVECTFGILKIRFKILKYPLRFRTKETIWNIFRTCCVFHNILLDYDGRDLMKKAEREEALGNLHVDEINDAPILIDDVEILDQLLQGEEGSDEPDEEELTHLVDTLQALNTIRHLPDMTGIGKSNLDILDVMFVGLEGEEVDSEHQKLHSKLVAHFDIIVKR